MPSRSIIDSPRALGVIALTSSLLGACSPPHATLTVPASRAAPPAERLQAFERYRPAATSNTVVIQSGTAVQQTTDFLVLADGTRIYHAEDLAGAVFPDSATARAAERSHQRYSRARMLSTIGWAAVAVGFGITLVPALTADHDEIGSSTKGLTIGIGVAAVGIVVGLVGGASGRHAHDEKLSAFTTYEADLRTRLDLCVNQTEVVDCQAAREQGVAVPATPAPAAPAPTVPAPASTVPAPAPAAPAPAPTAPAPAVTAPAPPAVPTDPVKR